MRKILLIILFTPALLIGQNYDLNLVVTKNDRVVGGDFWVKVQVRANTTYTSGVFSIGLSFNPLAVSIPNDGSNNIPAANHAWLGFTDVGVVPFVKIGQNAPNEIAFGRGLTFSPPTSQLTTAWQDVIEFKFTIVDNTQKLEYENLGPGYNAAAQEWNNYNNGSPVLIPFGSGYDIITYKDGVWTGGNGTNGAPNETDAAKELIIDPTTSDNSATLFGNVEVDYFEIPSGFTLNMASNATMRPFNQASVNYPHSATSEFVLNSDNTGYSQYIGPAISGTIQQYAGTNEGWRNMSFPVQSIENLDLGGASANVDGSYKSYHTSPSTRDNCGNFGNDISTVNITQFEGGATLTEPHEWHSPASISAMGGTLGYSIFLGGQNFGTSGVIKATGIFNEPSASLVYDYVHSAPHALNSAGASQGIYTGIGCPNPDEPADHKANWDGWALVANPYPCGLSIQEFCDDNGNIPYDNIRIWNKGKTYTTADGTLTDIDYQYVAPGQSSNIPPMQAFWVKWSTAGNNQYLVFENDQRVFSTESFQKTGANEIELIALNLLDTSANSILLKFDDLATKQYDTEFDSYVLSQPGKTRPQIGFQNSYKVNNTEIIAPLYTNTVNQPQKNDFYPVRFWSRSTGTYSLSVNPKTLKIGWHIYIEDLKTAPGILHEITNKPYKFEYQEGSEVERFNLHFSNGIIDPDDLQLEKSICQFSHTAQGVIIKFKANAGSNANVQLYNSLGQVIFSENHIDTKNDFYIPISNTSAPQMYIVSVSTAQENATIKLVR